jgi:hypothetical protein
MKFAKLDDWRCGMSDIRREIAAHVLRDGLFAVRLHGGPWDGKEVGVHNPQAPVIAVHGPRNGNHRIWITHVYARRGEPYEYLKTETSEITASFSFSAGNHSRLH